MSECHNWLKEARLATSPLQSRFIAQTTLGTGGCLALPPEIGMQPGERLLAVRGSGLALGFLLRGPIVEEAQMHAEIEVFDTNNS